MADVLIVCVREDETLAKAFADMFERAGLHVGGAPGAPEDMRTCGAALVVWSQASIRSRAFLDAAQRAVNAGKAVVACLIAPPPPASINHAPAFDLSRWTGDPDDPVLDPLFFSVDRMVAAARAAMGVTASAAPARAAPQEHPASYFHQTPAPPPAAPPYARARAAAPPSQPVRTTLPRNPSGYDATPRPAPQQAYEAAPRGAAPARRPAAAPPPPRRADPRDQQDIVASEAQNWAAIRHSRDPEDFLRHLADFGQEGAFAELAQMKLAELEAEARRRTKNPAQTARQDGMRGPPVRLDAPRSPARPAARQESRQEPQDYTPPPQAREREPVRPPPAAFEPIRNEQRTAPRQPAPQRQPPRRQEPPPVAWRDEPREQRRAPPRSTSGGGAIRLLIIIVILAGGALAAGLFAGDRLGGLGLFGTQPKQTAEGDTTWGAESAEAGEADPRLQLDDSGATVAASAPIDPPRETRIASNDARSNRGGPEEPAARATIPRTVPEASSPQREQPTTVSTTANVSTTAPGSAPAAQPPLEIAPTPAPPSEEQMRVSAVGAAPTTPARAPRVLWAVQPSGARINDFFPQRASRVERGGRVELDCLVDSNGTPRCAVARETPAGYGFGSAAVRASSTFRAAPTLDDGTPSAGAQTRLVIVFRAPTDN